MISRNYHHISNHPVLSNLFPRENLIGGTKRQRNLSEILSNRGGRQGGGHDDGGGGGGGGGGSSDWNGSYHCQLYKRERSGA
jgi:hypothetical protein